LDARIAASNLTSLACYRHFLEATAAALIPLEAALEDSNVNAVVEDWQERARTQAIRSDLARIGGQVLPLPSVKRLSHAETLGVLYVLEGSRLGARYLLRTVSASSDPMVANATAYFGHGSVSLWQTFLAVLNQKSRIADEAGAVAGSIMAFNLFGMAFARL
jgi:heme oxygenase